MVSTDAGSSPLLADDRLAAFARLADEQPRSRLSAFLDSVVSSVMVLVLAPLLVLLAVGARLVAWTSGPNQR